MSVEEHIFDSSVWCTACGGLHCHNLEEPECPHGFPTGNGPGAGLSLFICSAAGWTRGFAGAVVCDVATAHQSTSSSQDCPFLLHMESAYKGSEASLQNQGPFWPLGGYLTISRGSWVRPASSGWKPEMMLNIPIMHRTAAPSPELSSPVVNSEKPCCRCMGTFSVYTWELKSSLAGHSSLPACRHCRRGGWAGSRAPPTARLSFVFSDRAAPGHGAFHVSPFPQASHGLLPGPAWHRRREETREYRVGLGAQILMSLRSFLPFVSRFFPSSIGRFDCRHEPCITIHTHDSCLTILSCFPELKALLTLNSLQVLLETESESDETGCLGLVP